jgi:hypothetical protein
MDTKIINGVEYKLITIHNRSKWISKNGDAINSKRINQCATIHINADGYPCFGGGIPVHLYVAKAWVSGYFDGAEVNHKDFNRKNFKSDNLEWTTHKENIEYSLKYNYKKVCDGKQGINNGRAKFTNSQIIQIRKMYDNGMKISDIVKYFYPKLQTAKQYKSVHSNFTNIAKRKTWKHI